MIIEYEDNLIVKIYYKESYTVFSYYKDNLRSISHYNNNTIHNENGPAFIEYELAGDISYEAYYIHGKIHREDGPAIIQIYDYNGGKDEHYWINGRIISEEDFAVFQLNKLLKEKQYNIHIKKEEKIYIIEYDLIKNGQCISDTIPSNFKDIESYIVELISS